MPKPPSPAKNIDKLLTSLRSKRDQAVDSFRTTHIKAHSWLQSNDLDIAKIRTHSKKLLSSGAVIGSLLLSPPHATSQLLPATTPKQRLASLNFTTDKHAQSQLKHALSRFQSQTPGHLDPSSQKFVEDYLDKNFGIKASNRLEGNQLNHSIGYIGYEQHLKRYPGDTIGNHDEELVAGIAPGLGAWGYFAHSQSDFTREDYLKEKYYFAVQTLYLPNWNQNHRTLYPWYKHRKMVAINPDNGSMVVGVVADAGPAKWTGKHFGGSPEVIKHLDLHLGSRKGKIMLFFVDDPEDKIPLGPITAPLTQQITTT